MFGCEFSYTGRVSCIFLQTWSVHLLIIFKTFFSTDKVVRKRKPVCPKKDTNQQCREHNEKPSVWRGWISWKGMYSFSGTDFRERIYLVWAYLVTNNWGLTQPRRNAVTQVSYNKSKEDPWRKLIYSVSTVSSHFDWFPWKTVYGELSLYLLLINMVGIFFN